MNHDFLAFQQPLEDTDGGNAHAIAFGFLRSAVDNIVIRDKAPEDLIADVEFEDTNGNGRWDFDPNDPDGSERLFIENIPMYLDSESEMAFLFSYGRALQDPALKAWKGLAANAQETQKALLKRARLNGAAREGKYVPTLEDSTA